MWKSLIATLALASLLATEAAALQSPIVSRKLLVPKGTVLKFSAVTPLDSATARPGDNVRLRLERPLVVDGVTLLAASAEISGKVTEVRRAHGSHDGHVQWKLNDDVALPGGGHLKCDQYVASYDPGDVPEQVAYSHENPFVAFVFTIPVVVLLAAIFVLFSPIEAPVLIGELIRDPGSMIGRGHDSDAVGSEYHLAQGATVLFVVAHDKSVKR